MSVTYLPTARSYPEHRRAIAAFDKTIVDGINQCLADGVPIGMLVAVIHAHDVNITNMMIGAEDE